MNIQQLEYLLAVDKYKHFGKAAQACYITQPTLSAMIQKIEDELQAKIFDRTTHPIRTTDFGKEILLEVNHVLDSINRLKERAADLNNTISGTLRLGIIPTVSTFILPNEIFKFLQHNPKVTITAQEFITEGIVKNLQEGKLDAGIIATPHHLAEDFFHEELFHEELMLYTSKPELIDKNQEFILSENLSSEEMWLLEEGNCLKNQMEHICHLKENNKSPHNLDFKAGNIHTLMQLVDRLGGMTVLPELALEQMTAEQKAKMRRFKKPFPSRTISIIYYKPTYKQKLIDSLAEYLRNEIANRLQYKLMPDNFKEINAD